MKDITQIIQGIISSLFFQFNCKEVVPVGGNFTLKTCNTYWLRPNKEITINGFKYKIIGLIINESITVKPISHIEIPVASETLFTIIAPTYRHGTARAVNKELTTLKQKDKTPFVWLYELFTEKFNTDKESSVAITADIRLFIFDEADPANMFTEKHYTDVIRPMKQLAQEIINNINSNRGNYNEVKEYSIVNLADWGEFNGFSGNEKKILDEEWSGLELKFTIEIKKNIVCEYFCN